jgi:hypothetical protein
MHSGYKLRVVTFGTRRRRSLGNVCKHRSMERSGVKCFHCTHVFYLTILNGGKRRNVGKLNNELNTVNQPCRSPFLVVCKHYRKFKEPPCAYSANNHRCLALSFREQLTRFYHKESSSPHPAIVPIEGAVLFELHRFRSILDSLGLQRDFRRTNLAYRMHLFGGLFQT